MTPISRTSGFTLVELLVAITITVGLSATMLLITTGTLNTWRRTQDQTNVDVQAALVLDYLERDIQAAVFRNDGHASLAVQISNSPAALLNHGWVVTPRGKPATSESLRVTGVSEGAAPAAIASARFGFSGAWLRFITTNSETDGSLPIAVSYQIVRRPVSGAIASGNPSVVRYALFRAAVANDLTFSAGTDVLSAAYASASNNPSTQRSAATLTNPNTTSDVIATNVVDFAVWLYRRDSAGKLQRIFPTGSSNTTHVATSTNTTPQVIDVMLRILSEEGANQISAIENGTLTVRPLRFASDADWWWGVVEANSHVYMRRVEVIATSL